MVHGVPHVRAKSIFQKRELRRYSISHGRATFQNCPNVKCLSCGKPIEILTFQGGVLIEELNHPSPNDGVPRHSFVYIPQNVTIEHAYSKDAKPAIALRAPITLEFFLPSPGGEKT